MDLTQAENDAIQSLPRDTPYLISGVSAGYFSLARHYGGINYNGKRYTYFPETDTLVRDDVLKFITKMRKPKRKSKPKPTEQQNENESTHCGGD